ncbi:MAG: hypothetical protein K9L28_05955 [Synergistales bacterium]|nr:hypothetical protein [Synergistales bacterium]
MHEERTRALVAGRKIFTDLWAIKGFEPKLCEDPADLPSLWNELTASDVALVIVEAGWYERVPALWKRRIESLAAPSWIPFPDIYRQNVEE